MLKSDLYVCTRMYAGMCGCVRTGVWMCVRAHRCVDVSVDVCARAQVCGRECAQVCGRVHTRDFGEVLSAYCDLAAPLLH